MPQKAWLHFSTFLAFLAVLGVFAFLNLRIADAKRVVISEGPPPSYAYDYVLGWPVPCYSRKKDAGQRGQISYHDSSGKEVSIESGAPIPEIDPHPPGIRDLIFGETGYAGAGKTDTRNALIDGGIALAAALLVAVIWEMRARARTA
ncbi:MAG TPA: hypothetical protein VKX17_02805 [Planctomycetota bacterium]|nr:hypothetical protein [Planctomycetota bacterium]